MKALSKRVNPVDSSAALRLETDDIITTCKTTIPFYPDFSGLLIPDQLPYNPGHTLFSLKCSCQYIGYFSFLQMIGVAKVRNS